MNGVIYVVTRTVKVKMPLSHALLSVPSATMALAGSAVACGTAIALRYRSVPANKYMAKTGPFIKDVHVSRKTFLWPFQKIKIIDLSPIDYHFVGSNMSKELVPFKLPLIFTIAPIHPDKNLQGFVNFATRLGDMDRDGIRNIIGGIVNGETRGFVGGMTIQEIFNDKDAFRNHVVDRVQRDLEQFGLEIHNANIEEMHDMDGNKYFENLKLKALEGANTQSRISVAEARKEGDIGEKERDVITRQARSKLEADAIEIETSQNQKISDYNRLLEITRINNKQQEDIATIEAHKATESTKIAVEADLNKQKQQEELEKLRSSEVVRATAEAEAIIKRAQAEADATKIRADALLYTKIKEADGTRAQLEAQAEGLGKIYDVSKTNPELANFYLALEKGLFNKDGLYSIVAEKQANAIHGLNPKINIWNTGSSNSGYQDVLTNLSKSIPPILDAVQEQTGLKLPQWKRDWEKEIKDLTS